MTAATSPRRYDLDWLRIFAILIVFLYHSTRFFNIGDWHIKNVLTYLWVEVLNIFINRWMMPLFFLISGASLFYAMGKSGGFRRFYVDKFLRLMIPVVFGSITYSALLVYIERYSHGQFSGSFISFFPEYLIGYYIGIGSPGNFSFSSFHLLYLFFLFVYGLILYPLFRWFKGDGQRFVRCITITGPEGGGRFTIFGF